MEIPKSLDRFVFFPIWPWDVIGCRLGDGFTAWQVRFWCNSVHSFAAPPSFSCMWKWGNGGIVQPRWTTQWAMPAVHSDLQLLAKYITKCVTTKTYYTNREVWKMRGGFLSQRPGIGQRGDRRIQKAPARAVNSISNLLPSPRRLTKD